MKTIVVAKTGRLLCDAIGSTCQSLGFKVIGSCTDGKEALDLIKAKDPDIAIIDVNLPTVNGLDIIKQLNKEHFYISHILYLSSTDPNLLRRVRDLKVNQILFPDNGISELAKCLLKAGSINQFKNKRIEEFIKDSQDSNKEDLLYSLTPAQLRILALVGTHKTMPEIARELFISPHTVNNHIANIRRKLELNGRGVLLRYALKIKHRLVEIDGRVEVDRNTIDYHIMQ